MINRRQFGTLVGAGAVSAALGACGTGGGQRVNGKTILILGGGFGGLTAARELRAALPPEHRIVLVDRRPTYVMGLRKIWILAGSGTRAEGERKRESLRAHGIDYRQATVTAIDAAARTVCTDGGELPFDYLLVALGAEARPDLVPGWSSDVFSLYSLDDCERLAPRIAALEKGRVSIAILAAPYPCPPAPYETAMTLDALFRRRGIRNQVQLSAWTVQPMALPLMGKAICDDFEARLAKKEISFTAKRKTVRLEGTTAVFENGELASDVLIAVPPHRPPAVVKECGLTGEGDWIPVDRATMRTKFDRVWAIGDCTELMLDNKMPLPKAGLIAEAHARVAVAGVLAKLLGRAPSHFEGRGFCWIEHGHGEAAKASFDFFAPGGPQVALPGPTRESFAEKVEFERARLTRWFS